MRLIWILFLVCTLSAVRAEDFTNAIHAYLQHRAEVEGRPGAIVIGIADDHDSSTVSFGKLGNGTDEDANGTSAFALHSGTGWFTVLLLQDMIHQGKLNLDDPVSKFLPNSVRVPSYGDHQITLRHLATETSGLPDFLDKLDPKRADDPHAGFDVEKLYAFLSDYKLSCPPGTYYGHGGVSWGILGHIMALKAGTNYEELVQERICRPLQMHDTWASVTPERKAHLVTEYNPAGYPTRWAEQNWGVQTPLGGLHSSVNDLLQLVAALGMKPCELTPLMHETFAYAPDAIQGRGIVFFCGGGYDSNKQRCVVIRSAAIPALDNRALLTFLLEGEWRTDRRPSAIKIENRSFNSIVGQYERAPDLALGVFAFRQSLGTFSTMTIWVICVLGVAALAARLWFMRTWRRRCIVLGCLTVVAGIVVLAAFVASRNSFCKRFHPGIAIRREGDRLFIQPTGSKLWPIADYKFVTRMYLDLHPIDVLVPPVQAELLQQSESQFFERMTCMPVDLVRDAGGKVTSLAVRYQGRTIRYRKSSDRPPDVTAPPKPCVPVALAPDLLEACVGYYQFPPDKLSPSGAKLKIWREGDHLVGQLWGENTTRGAMEIFPKTDTEFFIKDDGTSLTFFKDGDGKITDVVHHVPKLPGFPDIPDHRGKRFSNLSAPTATLTN